MKVMWNIAFQTAPSKIRAVCVFAYLVKGDSLNVTNGFWIGKAGNRAGAFVHLS